MRKELLITAIVIEIAMYVTQRCNGRDRSIEDLKPVTEVDPSITYMQRP